MSYLKSKFYPVDFDTKVIVNDPQSREQDASMFAPKYTGTCYTGIKGDRLNRFECYRGFEVRQPA